MAKRFGRRRRPTVAWMPTFGGASIPEATSLPFPGVEGSLTLDTSQPAGDVFWDAFPLTFDNTQGAVAAQAAPSATLRDLIQGNEWRLRRIVGKIFITATTATVGATTPVLADVGFGFIVCNTDDTGAPQTDFDAVNPLSQDSMEDPWIWRRRWILNPYGLIAGSSPQTSSVIFIPSYWGFPQMTANYGSVADGPHVDAKSNRRIHRSERLFAVIAARKWAGDLDILSGPASDLRLQYLLDYRLLGSLKASQYGNRGNMSR